MTAANERWTTRRANDWWSRQDWVCGCNFLPSTSVNFLEMWMAETFDRETIARELGWAADTGFNSVRTNLHFLIWKHDREGLIGRLNWFLETASSLGLSVMPVLFDDCGFGGFEPKYGSQPDAVRNIHNSRAVASPGRAAVMNRALWPEFEAYVRDVVGQFNEDSRVLIWDLYNEPGNGMIFSRLGEFAEFNPELADHSRDLMLATFGWARDVRPVQPLTVAAWRTPPAGSSDAAFDNEIDRLALELSDVITFHAYCTRARAEALIDQLAVLDRPLLSTEWMARTIDSRIADQLPMYHDRKVGCYNWGLVQGRTQTHLPWPHTLEAQHGVVVDDTAWFHDILRPDGTPYDRSETQTIAALTGHRKDDGAQPCQA